VLVVYRFRVASMTRGIIGRDSVGRALVLSLLTAFLPAAVVGFLFGDAIKDALFGPVPIAIAWAVGGAVLLLWRPKGRGHEIHQLTGWSALIIGVSQCIAMWPGVSRSLVTLLAGLAVGLSLSAAVEFSFLLGMITLAAATSLDLVRHGGEMVNQFGIARPVLGGVVAFVTAVVAVKWMVQYLATKSLAIFGWYRIAAAGVTTALLVAGIL
jgi:undecaprenyl-diphosphatase